MIRSVGAFVPPHSGYSDAPSLNVRRGSVVPASPAVPSGTSAFDRKTVSDGSIHL